jgi:hypothetical protein
MNERIRELYNQSLEEKYQYGGGDAKPGEMYSNYITVLNPEKFAELIVRECVSIVAKRKDQAIDDGWNVDEAMSMAEMDLEEHFGVEE